MPLTDIVAKASPLVSSVIGVTITLETFESILFSKFINVLFKFSILVIGRVGISLEIILSVVPYLSKPLI